MATDISTLVTFRGQLQETITANGGNYKGDLTKSVTHLIAFSPEGKKYQYAAQWGIQIISLRWLKDSLDRGMVLDEALYHPATATEDQGKGAWNRKAKSDLQLGKRLHAEQETLDQPRKMRRTASVKLGSQRDSLWIDITGELSETKGGGLAHLQSRTSMPAVRPVILESDSFASVNTLIPNDLQTAPEVNSQSMQLLPPVQEGYFANMMFSICGFNPKHVGLTILPSRQSDLANVYQETILRKCLVDNGAIVVDALMEKNAHLRIQNQPSFMIVPYNRSRSDIPSNGALGLGQRVVTDMWLERCLDHKTFEKPDDCPTSTPAPSFPIEAFRELTINSTGFERIDLLHVSKIAKLLGARYDEVLKPAVSVLVCEARTPNVDKLGHAQRWKIPAVSVDWLWSCMHSGRLQPFNSFLISLKAPTDKLFKSEQHGSRSARATSARVVNEVFKNGNVSPELRQEHKLVRTTSAQDILNRARPEDLEQKRRPGTDSYKRGPYGAGLHQPDAKQSTSHSDAAAENTPLREIPNNSPKPIQISPVGKNSLFRILEGPSSIKDSDQHPPAVPDSTSSGKTSYITPDSETIREAIQDLLKMKETTKITARPTLTGGLRTKRLMGRASSNMSNSSKDGTVIQPSRASSVDSMNTDGVGSVIVNDISQFDRAAASNFRGRAKVYTGVAERASVKNSTEQCPSGPGFPSLYQHHYNEEVPEPQRTQLEYADTDEAVALRKALAEKRRGRTREDQQDFPGLEKKEERRLKDDETILGSGWGAEGRTRTKDRRSNALHDF